MSGAPRRERLEGGARLRAAKHAVAEEVTTEFLARHPDWVAKYGAVARDRGLEDAAYHVEFLASALETGLPAAFIEYARWTGRVLSSRGIATTFLAENLEQVRAALGRRIGPELRAAVDALVSGAVQALAEPGPGPGAAASVLVPALVAGDRHAAVAVVEAELKGGARVLDLYAKTLEPALHETGRLWETNAITVAQEHMATAIVELILSRLYARLERGPVARGPAIVAGVAGERHQVGGRMVADALETDGWDVRFLGSDVPTRDLLATVRATRPRAIGLSCTLFTNVRVVRELIGSIRETMRDAPRVVVGGAAFRARPELALDLGADGSGTNVLSAIEAFRPS